MLIPQCIQSHSRLPAGARLSLHFTPRHLISLHGTSRSALLCWYVKSHGMYPHVHVQSHVLVWFLCCTHAPRPNALRPHAPRPHAPRPHALVLMPSCACPRIHALYSLFMCRVSCYPASIVLSFVFHGFVYVLPVCPLLNPFSVTLCIWVLPSSFTASHPVTEMVPSIDHAYHFGEFCNPIIPNSYSKKARNQWHTYLTQCSSGPYWCVLKTVLILIFYRFLKFAMY